MLNLLIILTIYFQLCIAFYEYIPGLPYKSFIPLLQYEQKVDVMKRIFNPHKSRENALKSVRDWAYRKSPLTEMNLDRAIFDYEAWIETENKKFLDKEAKLSDEAQQLGLNIRSIVMDMRLSEQKTCQQISQTISQYSINVQKELGVEPLNCTCLFEKLKDKYSVIL